MLNRYVLPAIACSALLMSGCTTASSASSNASHKQNTEIVLAFLDGVFNKHQVKESFDKYVGTTYTQHQPKVADGPEAGFKGLTWLTTQKYPAMRIEVKRTAASDDLVWVHLRQIRDATDEKNGGGQAIVEIFRVTNGRITEHWDVVEEVADPATAANKNGMF